MYVCVIKWIHFLRTLIYYTPWSSRQTEIWSAHRVLGVYLTCTGFHHVPHLLCQKTNDNTLTSKKKKKFPGLTALEMQLYHLTCFKGWYWARVLQQAEYQSFMIALLCVPGDGCEDFYWSSRQSWRIVLWHLVQAFTWFLIYQDKLCSLLSTDTCKQGRAGEEQTMVGSGDKTLLKLHHFLSLFLEKAPRTWLEGNHGKDKPLSVSWR